MLAHSCAAASTACQALCTDAKHLQHRHAHKLAFVLTTMSHFAPMPVGAPTCDIRTALYGFREK